MALMAESWNSSARGNASTSCLSRGLEGIFTTSLTGYWLATSWWDFYLSKVLRKSMGLNSIMIT
jgi:hypothetical protein